MNAYNPELTPIGCVACGHRLVQELACPVCDTSRSASMLVLDPASGSRTRPLDEVDLRWAVDPAAPIAAVAPPALAASLPHPARAAPVPHPALAAQDRAAEPETEPEPFADTSWHPHRHDDRSPLIENAVLVQGPEPDIAPVARASAEPAAAPPSPHAGPREPVFEPDGHEPKERVDGTLEQQPAAQQPYEMSPALLERMSRIRNRTAELRDDFSRPRRGKA